MNLDRLVVCLAVVAIAGGVSAAEPIQPGISPGPGTRYATDQYPGFDNEDNILRPTKKEPRWFAWINGPKMDNAAAQFAWAKQCEAAGDTSKACRAYDALVREWPTAPESPKAQKALADLTLNGLQDYEDAFAEYRYLLDFYSLECDYDATVRTLYKIANLMHQEGKTVLFFHFANTVDVRRAYESTVLRASGADFAPEAMLTIAELREDEGKLETAITVYENLRNLHPGTKEAREAYLREARVRMRLLTAHGTNRARVNDTVKFLKLAERADVSNEARDEIAGHLAAAKDMFEDEAWRSAKFYDSKTRTKRSALNAYERYLEDYPQGAHAEEARARIDALKENVK